MNHRLTGFTHSVNKVLLSIYSVPGPVPAAGDTAVNIDGGPGTVLQVIPQPPYITAAEAGANGGSLAPGLSGN